MPLQWPARERQRALPGHAADGHGHAQQACPGLLLAPPGPARRQHVQAPETGEHGEEGGREGRSGKEEGKKEEVDYKAEVGQNGGGKRWKRRRGKEEEKC